jgi:hypothetical protein
MRRSLVGIFAAIAVVGLAALLVRAFIAGRAEQAKERERGRPVAAPSRLSRGPGGEVIVTLDRDAQVRIGLTVSTLTAATQQTELVASGTIQEDPSRSFTLRAPVAGTLLASGSRAWPSLGEVLADGAMIGAIQPRVEPATRVDLEARLAAAKSDALVAAAALDAARAAFERARALNAEGKIVSDRAVQDAESKMKAEEARLTAARATERLISASLGAVSGPTAPVPLAVIHGGEVVEVPARPGETIGSDQPILRVASFDTVLAKVDVPAGERVATVTAARVVLVGREDHPLHGERVAQTAADPKTRGQAFLFRLHGDSVPLRPGEAVTAYLAMPGAGRAGVVIPYAAVIRHQGRAWVYVERGDGQFARHLVMLDYPTAGGYFTSAFRPGERVVGTGAQVLLSEEQKSLIRVGDSE